MDHFKPKSLIFYAVAIGSVLLLFNRVTAYGNSNLQAPQNIKGTYPIKAQNLPECLGADSLALKLEQSGIYLVGSLMKSQTETGTSAEEKLPLTGEWQGGNLSLSGSITEQSCPEDTQVAIAGSINQETLNGQLIFNADPPIEFTAQRQTEAAPQEGH